MQPGQFVTCIADEPLYHRLLLVAPHLSIEEISLGAKLSYPARWFKACRPVDFDRFMEQVLPPPAEKRFEG